MSGERDSELCAVIQQTTESELSQITMDGKPYQSSKFALSLRTTLMLSYLGNETRKEPTIQKQKMRIFPPEEKERTEEKKREKKQRKEHNG